MTDQPKQINFTIVPDDATDAPRSYANFCAVNHTPFDFTITFCDMAPLRKRRGARRNPNVLRAPVKASASSLVAAGRAELITTLQEQLLRDRPNLCITGGPPLARSD